MEYYQLAADGGVAAGWRSIGFLYQYGLGVELDYGKAYDCFQRAAEQGDLQAMFNLGEYFREGKPRKRTWTKQRNGTGKLSTPDISRKRKNRKF